MGDWQWVINNGVAFAVLVFVGVILYRVLVGSKKTGYRGLLVQWADNLSKRIMTHDVAQTEFARKSQEHAAEQDDALRILVEAGEPPKGAAYIAAQAVYATAADVDRLKRAGVKASKVLRLLASKMPEHSDAITSHCDEIERIIGDG